MYCTRARKGKGTAVNLLPWLELRLRWVGLVHVGILGALSVCTAVACMTWGGVSWVLFKGTDVALSWWIVFRLAQTGLGYRVRGCMSLYMGLRLFGIRKYMMP